MSKKMAIVAVETNLVGRGVQPKEPDTRVIGFQGETQWPFISTKGVSDVAADVVACYVGDLDEGGALKFILLGRTTGLLRETYSHAFRVIDGIPAPGA